MGRYIDADDVIAATGITADAALTMQIAAAEGLIDKYLGRELLTGSRTETAYPTGGERAILLRAYPVTAITAITDATGGSPQYRLNAASGIVYLPAGAYGEVTISYAGGFSAVPEGIKYAAILLTQSLRAAAEHNGLTLMSERLGDYQIMYYNQPTGGDSLPAISRAAAALLAPYRGRMT